MRPKDPRVAHKPKCLKFTPSSFEIIDNYSNKWHIFEFRQYNHPSVFES